MENYDFSAPWGAVVARLHQEADAQRGTVVHAPKTYNGYADLADRYICVDPELGKFLYSLVRLLQPKVVVEFGTSFGVSTIYLAAGVRDNGAGHVYGSEFLPSKVARAEANLAEAHLKEHATIYTGEAQETLTEVPDDIGLVLLDGAKELYKDVFLLLEPKLSPRAVIVADNATMDGVESYISYVREQGYFSYLLPFHGGVEFTFKP